MEQIMPSRTDMEKVKKLTHHIFEMFDSNQELLRKRLADIHKETEKLATIIVNDGNKFDKRSAGDITPMNLSYASLPGIIKELQTGHESLAEGKMKRLKDNPMDLYKQLHFENFPEIDRTMRNNRSKSSISYNLPHN